MDYSSTWLTSSSLDHHHKNGVNTLRLFDDSPVREVVKMEIVPISSSNEVPSKAWFNDEVGRITEELNRVKAENKRLTEMLTLVCENYNDLKRQLTDRYMSKTASNEIGNVGKKRKVENLANNDANNVVTLAVNNNVESISSDEEDSSCGKPKEEAIKTKITKVAVRTEASDSTLILKDGYQWRKYGQKVTRDNPCPRAYFKCSFAPTCPVKKKVQRSLEDQSMLVATYEGEHNHAPPSQETTSGGSTRGLTISSVASTATVGGPVGPTITLNLTKTKPIIAKETTKMLSNTSNQLNKFSSAEFQKLLAEQMASSLTKDPNFTSVLAAAISGRMVQQSSSN